MINLITLLDSDVKVLGYKKPCLGEIENWLDREFDIQREDGSHIKKENTQWSKANLIVTELEDFGYLLYENNKPRFLIPIYQPQKVSFKNNCLIFIGHETISTLDINSFEFSEETTR